MFREAEEFHFEGDCPLEDGFELIFSMAWAELARMAVHRESHYDFWLPGGLGFGESLWINTIRDAMGNQKTPKH